MRCTLLLVLTLQKLMDMAKKPLSVQETWETRYEQLMEQFASDMRLYMGMVSAIGPQAGCALHFRWSALAF